MFCISFTTDTFMSILDHDCLFHHWNHSPLTGSPHYFNSKFPEAVPMLTASLFSATWHQHFTEFPINGHLSYLGFLRDTLNLIFFLTLWFLFLSLFRDLFLFYLYQLLCSFNLIHLSAPSSPALITTDGFWFINSYSLPRSLSWDLDEYIPLTSEDHHLNISQ